MQLLAYGLGSFIWGFTVGTYHDQQTIQGDPYLNNLSEQRRLLQAWGDSMLLDIQIQHMEFMHGPEWFKQPFDEGEEFIIQGLKTTPEL